MNADHLLEAFDRLGNEPETVQQFRKLVIGLAMSGKLLSPDEAVTEPASMLKQIEAKKCVLVQQGILRKQNPLATLSLEDLPKGFNDPVNFVRLGNIARIEKGLTGIMKAESGPYPLVVTAEDRAACDHFDFDGAAAIVPLVSSAGHGKASLQRLHYQQGKFALGSILAAIFPHAPEIISARFLFEYLTSFKDELLVSRMIGTANVSLSVGKVSDVPVPLVPPSVQRKVDKLMGLCDRLDAARASREGVRDRLVAASLARFNAPDPETFQADARFALDALPALTTRPDQIKAVRQTILNLAVRGKLVRLDSNDEPASELLKRIAKERTGAQALKKARRNGEADVSSLRSGTPLPVGWLWTNIDEIALSMRYGTSTKCEYAAPGVPVLRIPNVSGGFVSLDDMKFGPLTDGEARDLALNAGDLLMIRSNGSLDIVGRSAVVTPEAHGMAFAGYLVRLRLSLANIKPEYIWLALNSADVRDQIERPIRSAVGLKNVNLTEFGALTIPLPPLTEQHRIVAKVDALMALCDWLEANLTATAATRRRLLDALLAEALTPADDRELEAAE
jgi:type I restriction enzyme, S subunit